MPFFYDLVRAFTSSTLAATETTNLWGKTIANQQMVSVSSIFGACRYITTGGGIARAKWNTGVTASGGTAQTPSPRHPLMRAADSVWANDATAITPGTILTTKVGVGLAQTGGMGGWVAMEPDAQIRMMPNATNPVDIEFSSLFVSTSVLGDLTIEMKEGN